MTEQLGIVRRPGTRRPSQFMRVDPGLDPTMKECKIRLVPGLVSWDCRAEYGGSVPAGFGYLSLYGKDSVGVVKPSNAAGTGFVSYIDGRSCFDLWKLNDLPSERGLIYYNDTSVKSLESSCSAWVRIPPYAETGNVRRIIWSRYTNWILRHEGGTRLQYEYTDNGAKTVDAPSNTINDNKWHHVACTLSHANQRGRLYEDGVLVREGAYTYHFASTWGVVVGSRDNSLRWQISRDCYYDDMCYWTRELSPEEIRYQYENEWAAFEEYSYIPPIYVPPPRVVNPEVLPPTMRSSRGRTSLTSGSAVVTGHGIKGVVR